MIDQFALLLTHALMGIAALRMLLRSDLDKLPDSDSDSEV